MAQLFNHDPDPYLVRISKEYVKGLPLPTLSPYMEADEESYKFYINHQDGLKITELKKTYGRHFVSELSSQMKQAYLIEALVYSTVVALDK